jgi:hypothetical protein
VRVLPLFFRRGTYLRIVLHASQNKFLNKPKGRHTSALGQFPSSCSDDGAGPSWARSPGGKCTPPGWAHMRPGLFWAGGNLEQLEKYNWRLIYGAEISKCSNDSMMRCYWNSNRPACCPNHVQAMFSAFIFLLLGDMDHHSNEYGLNNAGANDMCFACPANRSNYNFTSVGIHAAWKPLVYAPPGFMAAPSNHEVWNIPNITRYSAQFDPMHCVDGGVTEHVAGNVLFTTVFNTDMLGPNIQATSESVPSHLCLMQSNP